MRCISLSGGCSMERTMSGLVSDPEHQFQGRLAQRVQFRLGVAQRAVGVGLAREDRAAQGETVLGSSVS